MKLAIFDLDNTLLAGDSDHAWGAFMTEHGIVDADDYARHNDEFLRHYQQGTLDIDAYLRFALAPLAEHPAEDLEAWRAEFIERDIRPLITPAARELVESHRRRGHTLMLITATNAFVTGPIAELFDIPHLLATEPERRNGRYTGRYTGTPTFQHGKILALEEWLETQQVRPEETWFYSDSRNDLPLLEQVDHPAAVDPDPVLRREAEARGWPVLALNVVEEPAG
ncbi:HAD-IB family hydrolase [Guyparkeria hydrothermalis]|uniref:histidinol-phosphatase n=1 Tax=Guyparkeria TaxID=2035712 RepID=UPI0010ADA0D7|nr:HAD family hydrolase [Guyparkeria sp. SB14A]MCL7750486.1 HAD-IB family hydrolase [Guyparkeria hydrothermalis]TKA90597.1 HAD family hydrolase [Guyparkeria sp. SB14A]